MNIHIEGMGVLGSVLAWHLYKGGYSFTWNDTKSKIAAWPASTGCVYPSGDSAELAAYRVWKSWHRDGAPWSKFLTEITEQAKYWFLTKKPPNGGRYEIEGEVPPLRCGELETVQVNAQALVTSTRAFFGYFEGEASRWKGKSKVVIAHGFDKRRLTHYQWGWSAPATLEIADLIQLKPRPCFYLRRGRFSPLVYAYPKPGGEKVWYAGSSTIRQRVAKSLDLESKVETWKKQISDLTENLVKVTSVGKPTEGWRPCGEKGSKELVRVMDGQLVVRPMEGNGVRLAPLVVAKILEKLCEI